jgi:hypothetical protein
MPCVFLSNGECLFLLSMKLSGNPYHNGVRQQCQKGGRTNIHSIYQVGAESTIEKKSNLPQIEMISISVPKTYMLVQTDLNAKILHRKRRRVTIFSKAVNQSAKCG